MSTKTGRAARRVTALPVAKKLNGVVMTSSPGPTFNAISASNSASEPEAQPIASFVWQYAATSASRAATSGPITNCCVSNTRSTARHTASRIGAYCACKSINGTFMPQSFSRKGGPQIYADLCKSINTDLRKSVADFLCSLSCSLICIRVGLVVVGIVTRIVVVVARIDLHVVQHHAKHVRADVEQLLLGATHHGPRTSPAMDHENHSIHHRRKDRRI